MLHRMLWKELWLKTYFKRGRLKNIDYVRVIQAGSSGWLWIGQCNSPALSWRPGKTTQTWITITDPRRWSRYLPNMKQECQPIAHVNHVEHDTSCCVSSWRQGRVLETLASTDLLHVVTIGVSLQNIIWPQVCQEVAWNIKWTKGRFVLCEPTTRSGLRSIECAADAGALCGSPIQPTTVSTRPNFLHHLLCLHCLTSTPHSFYSVSLYTWNLHAETK